MYVRSRVPGHRCMRSVITVRVGTSRSGLCSWRSQSSSTSTTCRDLCSRSLGSNTRIRRNNRSTSRCSRNWADSSDTSSSVSPSPTCSTRRHTRQRAVGVRPDQGPSSPLPGSRARSNQGILGDCYETRGSSRRFREACSCRSLHALTAHKGQLRIFATT